MKSIIITPLLVIISLSVTLSGCIDSDENSVGFIFTAWFNDVEEGAYIYFPAIIDSSNKTIIDINEYYFKSGNGNIEYEQINGTMMLNISASTNGIEVKVERKNQPEDKWNLKFTDMYANNTGGKNYNYTRIYYSGNNQVYTSSGYSFIKPGMETGFVIGPYYLSNGWNNVRIDGSGSEV